MIKCCFDFSLVHCFALIKRLFVFGSMLGNYVHAWNRGIKSHLYFFNIAQNKVTCISNSTPNSSSKIKNRLENVFVKTRAYIIYVFCATTAAHEIRMKFRWQMAEVLQIVMQFVLIFIMHTLKCSEWWAIKSNKKKERHKRGIGGKGENSRTAT